MDRTVTPATLKEMLDARKDIMLLDVRRRSDRDADPVALPSAVWRDPEQVNDWGARLPADKEVVIYCARGGSVSNRVLDQLLEQHLPAQYLEGGIAAWKTVGNKTEPLSAPEK